MLILTPSCVSLSLQIVLAGPSFALQSFDRYLVVRTAVSAVHMVCASTSVPAGNAAGTDGSPRIATCSVCYQRRPWVRQSLLTGRC